MTDRPAAGFLAVDKPAGPTSHDVVSIARRELRQKRIGHTGTLDPFASGLLLLAIGHATRLTEYLADLSKTYRATVRLGAATDTDDRTGAVISSSSDWSQLDHDSIRAALARQTGSILQMPPTYSARKVGGRRMYEAAREGRVVAATPSRVVVHSIDILRFDLPELDLEITCSTGTYIRAIARDMGTDLGVFGHLMELRRTRIGPYAVDDAVALSELADSSTVAAAWIDPVRAVGHLHAIEADAGQARDLRHGRSIGVSAEPSGGVAAAIHNGELIAIGHVADGVFHPRKVFAP